MFIFFNRKSPLIKFIHLIALVLSLYLSYNSFFKNKENLYHITFLISVLLYIILFLFAFIPWYGFKYKGRGIEEHYENILIPGSYTILMSEILYYLGIQLSLINIFLIALYTIFLFIHFTLLIYHFSDLDQTPPAYFASEEYLQNDSNQKNKPVNLK